MSTTHQIIQLRDTEFGRTEDAWPVLYATEADALTEWERRGPTGMFENTDDEDRPSYFVRELHHYIATGVERALA